MSFNTYQIRGFGLDPSTGRYGLSDPVEYDASSEQDAMDQFAERWTEGSPPYRFLATRTFSPRFGGEIEEFLISIRRYTISLKGSNSRTREFFLHSYGSHEVTDVDLEEANSKKIRNAGGVPLPCDL